MELQETYDTISVNLDEVTECEGCGAAIKMADAYLDFAVTSAGDQELGFDRTITFMPTITCAPCALAAPRDPVPFPIGGPKM